jgi:hypothetical protein
MILYEFYTPAANLAPHHSSMSLEYVIEGILDGEEWEGIDDQVKAQFLGLI